MSELLTTGSEAWWESKKGPQWQPEGDDYRVTFWWRDPAGSEQTSAIQRVWIYITGVTDHHQGATPQTLERLPGTDVWQWQTLLPGTWRGTYCFIPSVRDDDFPSEAFSPTPERGALRSGWAKLLPQAIADPRNPQGWRGGRGHGVSALEMPQAPVQPGWNTPAECFTPPVNLTWRSTRLNNTRRVWVYSTGRSDDASRPLAVLLDGQFWAESQPLWPVLAGLTAQGKLPPAVYVLIDAIDIATRGRELSCKDDFWQAVQQELLPQVQCIAPFSDRPERTVVAGQSFGGLAAMYAGLKWPQRFGCVLSQSGSFWWPHRHEQQEGVVLEKLKHGELSPQGLRIWLEAGKREPVIYRANQALLSQLQKTPQPVFWQPFDGGHDALCWRGGLTAGLMALWQPVIQAGI